jgi:hypothetical protein
MVFLCTPTPYKNIYQLNLHPIKVISFFWYKSRDPWETAIGTLWDRFLLKIHHRKCILWGGNALNELNGAIVHPIRIWGDGEGALSGTRGHGDGGLPQEQERERDAGTASAARAAPAPPQTPQVKCWS